MARNITNLLELDVEKLFETHKIEEIVEISKLLDAEIERKRVDLRSMVGDRYKDVLAASDAITNMKTISQNIVDNIENITNICEKLIATDDRKSRIKEPESVDRADASSTCIETMVAIMVSNFKIEERTLIIQIRLLIFINELIWIALDKGDNLLASQFYLLAQHIHMGLKVNRGKDLRRLRLLDLINMNLTSLKDQIISRIEHKLETVEITAEDTSSNLNALLLLQNQSANQLLEIFISHRKTALYTVINTSYESVRVQICAMMRCITTTIRLLHDCFISFNDSNTGLIWQQLENVVNESSGTTLSKVKLPNTPLMAYVPEIITRYRPKCDCKVDKTFKNSIALEEWLQSTKILVQKGLESLLKLVTNVKGLHFIREEALKIELPEDWRSICSGINLNENFNIWSFFFQDLVTGRVEELVSKKVLNINETIQKDIEHMLNLSSDQKLLDLGLCIWDEDNGDVSHVDNKHVGLSMKTLGYSQSVVTLCDKLDQKYLDLLVDVSQYLYGKEYQDGSSNLTSDLSDYKVRKKIVDKDEIENHLRIECTNNASLEIYKVNRNQRTSIRLQNSFPSVDSHPNRLTAFLQDFINNYRKQDDTLVAKSLICARFLQAITNLCSHFARCCSLNGSADDWARVCQDFNRISLKFWSKWVDKCVRDVHKQTEVLLGDMSSYSTMMAILPKWDVIEIQEQDEEKVFKSQIRVPLKPSLTLQDVLLKLNDDLCGILPHTLPKAIHLQFLEKNVRQIFEKYKEISLKADLTQNQSLQFLFDVKFLTVLCVPIDNMRSIGVSQEICDNFRSKIDPFDLDVFYAYLQANVKRAVLQSQMILGCLLPSPAQLANLGVSEKSRDQENEPSILALSTPMLTSWFPLLPVSAPTPKVIAGPPQTETQGVTARPTKITPKKVQDPASVVRSGAAALFGNLTTDWFS